MKPSVIRAMDEAGVDIFRINMSHVKVADLENLIAHIRSATKKNICLDTEGAQIRTGHFESGVIQLVSGHLVEIVPASESGNSERIPIYPIIPLECFLPGDILLLDFHNASLQIVECQNDKVKARVITGGQVGSNKGVSLDRAIDLPALTEKDRMALTIARKAKLTDVALSFCAGPSQVRSLRHTYRDECSIICKIESRAGLENLDEILTEADAILIDRGDLGRDIAIQKIALAQRYILERGIHANKEVYVATNLLETMGMSLHPSRAEINDITSTLYGGASGLVLAAETAIGKYPVESVRMITSITTAVRHFETLSGNCPASHLIERNLQDGLIPPHGGKLIQSIDDNISLEDTRSLPHLPIDSFALLDLQMLADGVCSPLKGFMNSQEIQHVLTHNQLSDGNTWPLPILLQLSEAPKLESGQRALLVSRANNAIVGLIHIDQIEKIDLKELALLWFGDTNPNHPGVDQLFSRGEYIVSGSVTAFSGNEVSLAPFVMSPRQSRTTFLHCGWRRVLGLSLPSSMSLKEVPIPTELLLQNNLDAVFISPVLGVNRSDVLAQETQLMEHQDLVGRKTFGEIPSILAPFNSYVRHSGAREVVFNALCLKNFGCSHYLLELIHDNQGRDADLNENQRLLEALKDIGILPVSIDLSNIR